MSSGNAAWTCRKGRTQKEPNQSAGAARKFSKEGPYANTHLFAELNRIVVPFTQQQKNLAESTGFGSFAKPVHELQLDRQFTMWLLPKVCSMARSIASGIGKRIMIFKEDITKVFGVPCSGKDPWDSSLDKSQKLRDKISCLIGMDEENTSPIAAAFKTLKNLTGNKLTPDEEIAFQVSFVVFVVCLLGDSSNPGDSESVNFWPALARVDDIHTFNWSNYLLDSIFSACAAAKMATRKNIAYTPPAGTALFLQVCTMNRQRYPFFLPILIL
jgi:hypothetical protein